jgi:uncharacterized RDD family membrane protein YckC
VVTTEPARVEYAAWRARFLALLADVALCGGALLLVDLVIAVALALVFSSDPGAWGEVVGAFSVFAFVLVFPLYLALFAAGESGRTPGKQRVEIAVRTASTFGRLSYARALIRSYVPAPFWELLLLAPLLGLGALTPLAALFLLLDALWPLWSRRQQALHDKIAGTVVIRSSERT